MDEDNNDISEFLEDDIDNEPTQRIRNKPVHVFYQDEEIFHNKKSIKQKIKKGLKNTAKWGVATAGMFALAGFLDYKTNAFQTTAGYALTVLPHQEEGRFWEAIHTFEQQKASLQRQKEWEFMPDIGPLPDVHVLSYFPLSKDNSIKMRTADGSVFYEKEPTEIYLEKIPENLKKAFVWGEDEAFYQHKGINWKGKAGGVWSTIIGNTRGGSSITEQVAKQIKLDKGEKPVRNGLEVIVRKAKEMATAVELEREYDKEQILNFYANYMYFGAGMYGAETASKIYFGKSTEKLALNEAIFLTCMLNDPSNDPRTEKGFAIQWKDYTKEIEKLERKKYISENEAKEYIKEEAIKIKKVKRSTEQTSIYATALNTVYNLGFAQQLGINIREAIDPTERWYSVDITTTIDANATQAAYHALSTTQIPEGTIPSMVVLDEEQRIVAIMSGKTKQKFSTAGGMNNKPLHEEKEIASTIKPLYWVYGLEKGFFSMRDTFDERTKHRNDGNQWPNNHDGKYDRTMTAHRALINSNNRISVQIYDRITERIFGISRLRRYFMNIGLGTEYLTDLSIPAYALGLERATALELAHVYNTLFNEAEQCGSWIIQKVVLGDEEFHYSCQATTKSMHTNIPVREALEDVAKVVNVHNPHGTVGFKTGTNTGPTVTRIAGFYEYKTHDYSFVIDVDKDGKIVGKNAFAGQTNGPIANKYLIGLEG